MADWKDTKLHHELYVSGSRELFDEPDLAGDLLLIALAMLYHLTIDRVDEPKTPARVIGRVGPDNVVRRVNWVRDACWRIWPDEPEDRFWGHLKRIIMADTPRYVPTTLRDEAVCMSMLERNPTKACPHKPTVRQMTPNPQTGETDLVGSCSNPTHLSLFNRTTRRNRDLFEENGRPKPPNNAGGVLERTFPDNWEIDWPALYTWASGNLYDPTHPEGRPARARLTLVE